MYNYYFGEPSPSDNTRWNYFDVQMITPNNNNDDEDLKVVAVDPDGDVIMNE